MTLQDAPTLWQKISKSQEAWWQAVFSNQETLKKGFPMDPAKVMGAVSEAVMRRWTNPQSAVSAQVKLLEQYQELINQTLAQLNGEAEATAPSPKRPERRYRDERWQANPFFKFLKDAHGVTAQWLEGEMQEVEGLPNDEAARLQFYTKQISDAFAPSNFPFTNPSVIEETLKTNGENLQRGIENMMRDFKANPEGFRIAMTPDKAFTLGEDIAATPGKVVFRNRLFELIHYTPQTDTVYEIPLLVIPPWINKYYILDLQHENSLVNWLVQQGHSVFLISWKNPESEVDADLGFGDYFTLGLEPAIDAILNLTKAKSVNTIGYCIGGTLLAASLAVLAKRGETKKVNHATFLTTMIDFTEPGELGVFANAEQLKILEPIKAANGGMLSGTVMHNTYNALRANDLIWSYFVSNYLLGKAPAPFDILHWNSDVTRLAGKMHSELIQRLYIDNEMIGGAFDLNGEAVDLKIITTPCLFVSTARDHIAPWRSTFMGAKALRNAKVDFILAGSGHTAGVVNPPAKQKYGYWTGNKPISSKTSPESWQETATEHKASWWTAWQGHASKISGKLITPPAINTDLDDAPGRYIRGK